MLATNFFSCAFMTGVIWIIQLLHYPAFAKVDLASFNEFHKSHSQRISFIVGPMMLLELATAILLFHQHPTDHLILLNLILLIAIWICTFALSVPVHNALEKGKDLTKIEKLVRTNWPRTILWSLRSLILIWITSW